jgi:hypothetical protein
VAGGFLGFLRFLGFLGFLGFLRFVGFVGFVGFGRFLGFGSPPSPVFSQRSRGSCTRFVARLRAIVGERRRGEPAFVSPRRLLQVQ